MRWCGETEKVNIRTEEHAELRIFVDDLDLDVQSVVKLHDSKSFLCTLVRNSTCILSVSGSALNGSTRRKCKPGTTNLQLDIASRRRMEHHGWTERSVATASVSNN